MQGCPHGTWNKAAEKIFFLFCFLTDTASLSVAIGVVSIMLDPRRANALLILVLVSGRASDVFYEVVRVLIHFRKYFCNYCLLEREPLI